MRDKYDVDIHGKNDADRDDVSTHYGFLFRFTIKSTSNENG